MATGARNDVELKAQLMPLFAKAVDQLMTYIVNDNQDLIQKYVYDAYEPTAYERTMGFKESWKASKAEVHDDEATAEFGFAPEMMVSIPEAFIHGSPSWGDVREYMADIIYQGKAGDLFGEGAWTKKRDAWSQLIKHLGKRRFDQYVKAAFRSVGLTLTKAR